jgi:hypothetical protein
LLAIDVSGRYNNVIAEIYPPPYPNVLEPLPRSHHQQHPRRSWRKKYNFEGMSGKRFYDSREKPVFWPAASIN